MISSTNITLIVIGVSLLVMTLGFIGRSSKYGVASMLLGIVGVLASIAFYITYVL